jgi:hypothetical protein
MTKRPTEWLIWHRWAVFVLWIDGEDAIVSAVTTAAAKGLKSFYNESG